MARPAQAVAAVSEAPTAPPRRRALWVSLGILALLSVAYCNTRPAEAPSPPVMAEAVAEAAAGASTDPVTPAAVPSPALYYRGDACTDDCSGHEAGYEWAKEKGIDDADDCDTASDSFNEGCRSYVEENSDDEDVEQEPQ